MWGVAAAFAFVTVATAAVAASPLLLLLFVHRLYRCNFEHMQESENVPTF